MSDIDGVGIDIEEIHAFDRFNHLTISRVSARWLSQAELAWCAGQYSLARAIVVVFSCREAVFKSARGLRPAHELCLQMTGDLSGGRGIWYDEGRIEIELGWRVANGRVVALAVARDRACMEAYA